MSPSLEVEDQVGRTHLEAAARDVTVLDGDYGLGGIDEVVEQYLDSGVGKGSGEQMHNPLVVLQEGVVVVEDGLKASKNLL